MSYAKEIGSIRAEVHHVRCIWRIASGATHSAPTQASTEGWIPVGLDFILAFDIVVTVPIQIDHRRRHELWVGQEANCQVSDEQTRAMVDE